MRRRWLLALALASTTAEDEAVAAYVRFAKNTLPRLEKAWAAPHRAAAAKQEAGPALHDGQGAP